MLRNLYRRLYWLPRDLIALQGAGWPDWIVYFGGKGFGDDLLLTAVMRKLRESDAGRLAVISRLTEIFDHSPDVDLVLKADWRVLDAQIRWGRKAAHAIYFREAGPPDMDVPPRGHMIAEMARCVGLDGEIELRPQLFLQAGELEAGLRTNGSRPQVAIQCMSPASVNAAPNKVWPEYRYQDVVDQNRHRFDFVQLGSKQDPRLKGALDLRGQTSIRESAAVLARSNATVCYAGFLMHLARAVDTRAVVVFGGREHPSFAGYPCNENLFTPLPCSPCWRRQTCVADHACLKAIDAEHVSAALDRILIRNTTPLEIAYEGLAETVPHPIAAVNSRSGRT